jgi:hypothetical protein
MKRGGLIIFVAEPEAWSSVVADLDASGAECTFVATLETLENLVAQNVPEGIVVERSRAAALGLDTRSWPLLYAEDLLPTTPEDTLIDPFETHSTDPVLRTLDRQLDRIEGLLQRIER